MPVSSRPLTPWLLRRVARSVRWSGVSAAMRARRSSGTDAISIEVSCTAAEPLFYDCRLLRDSGCIEQGSYRQFELQLLTDSRHEERSQHRVSSQIQEVLMDARSLDLEDVRPEVCQSVLQRAAGWGKVASRWRSRPSRAAQLQNLGQA